MKKYILLVDDDYDDAEIFTEALLRTNLHTELIHQENGKDALEFLNSDKILLPDFIFLDINMPFLNGWQTLSIIKNKADIKHVPVIMFTTSSNVREKEIALDLGAYAFITKPTDIKVLVELLTKILSSQSPQASASE